MPAFVGLGLSLAHLTADGQVKASRGRLHTVVINKTATTAGVITLYDSLTETGNVIAAITVPTGGQDGLMPVSLTYDIIFQTGLYAGFDGTIAGADITITYD